jgi:hypothetical protein
MPNLVTTYPSPAASPSIWIYGNNMATPQPTNNANIPAWRDPATPSISYDNLTILNQPIYVASGANNANIARFDGTNDILVASVGVASPANMTLFMVLTPSSTSQSYAFSSKVLGGNAPAIICNYDPGSGLKQFEWFNGGSERFTLKASGANAGLNIITITRVNNGGAFNSWFNGASASSGTASTNTIGNILNNLGNSDANLAPYGGDIAEVIIYNRILTGQERVDTNRYLSNKYTIAIV